MCMPITPSGGDHHGQKDADNNPQHQTLVARTVLPEVDQDDPDAVEGVVEHRRTNPTSISPTIGVL